MNPNHYTSLELSKMLKEAGAPQVSRVYWVPYMNGEVVRYKLSQDKVAYARWGANDEPIFSAFSVAELGERLPKKIINEKLHPVLYLTCHLNDNNCSVAYETFNGKINFQEFADAEAEARGLMYLYLLKNKLIEGVKV